MNALDMIINFFKQGGAFLYPIAAVFAVGLGFAVERFIYLHRVARGNRRLWAELAPLIQAGNFRRAMETAEKTDSALSTIMRYGMSRIATAHRREDIEKAMEESLIEEVLAPVDRDEFRREITYFRDLASHSPPRTSPGAKAP